MNKCPVCNTKSSKQRESTPYWICSSCDLWFQNPLPSKVFHGDHEPEGHLMSDYEKSVNADLANWLMSKIPACDQKYSALDIGSKYPYLSKCLKDLGADVMAMDNITAVPEYSISLEVPMLLEDFETWEFGISHLKKYNLITMVHVFEHMYNPVAALRKLHGLLRSDGILFIRMPANDVPGIERDLVDSHYKIHPYVHSLNSITEILLQLEDLFVVEYIWNFNGIGQRDLILRPVNKKPTIYMGMIVKNEERDLPLLLKSVKDVIEGALILDTGSTDNTVQIAKSYSKILECRQYTQASELVNGEWLINDFSKARNQYIYELETFTQADWILTMDADDELLDPRRLSRLRYLNCYDCFSMRIWPADFPHHRMWKSKAQVRFMGAVHEIPNISHCRILDTNIRIEHNYAPHNGVEGSNDRNLRILLEEHKNLPTTRNTFYIAQTYKDRGDWQNAVNYYDKYLLMNMVFRDEWLFACLYKARCEKALGNNEAAINTLLKGIIEDKNWAEFWMELAYTYYSVGQYYKCISNCYMALSCINTPSPLWRETNKYTDQPRRMLSFCYEMLKDMRAARKWAYRAKEAIGMEDLDWNNRITYLNKKRILLRRLGALGDVIMTLNVVKPLKEKYPDYRIDYLTSPIVKSELGYLMLETGLDNIYTELEIYMDDYDIVFDLVGYPFFEGYPFKPMKKHLIEYFADEVGVKVDLSKKLEFSAQDQIVAGGYVTIHPTAAWSRYKNWPISEWEKVVADNPNVFFVQIGSKEDPVIKGTVSYLGAKLKDSIALIANAKVHMGVDSFGNHISHASFGGKSPKTIILWGSTQWSAAGYDHNINISTELSCQPCFRENLPIAGARADKCPNQTNGVQNCMYGIDFETVSNKLKQLLNS